MSFCLFTRQRFFTLPLATAFVAFIAMAATLVYFTQSSIGQDSDDLRFRVQAKRMFSLYDSNKDGYLSQAEMKELKDNQVRAPRFDVDKDNRLSVEELVDAISRESSAKVDGLGQPPSVTIGTSEDKSKNDELVKMYRRFLDASMKKNDTNQDGTLDPKEIAAGRWSSSWRDSDLDGDGNLTRAEMQKRYEKMFGVSLGLTDTEKALVDLANALGKDTKAQGVMSQDGSGGVVIAELATERVRGVGGMQKKQEKEASDKKRSQNPTFFFLKYRKADQMVEFLNEYFDLKQTSNRNARTQQMMSMMSRLSGGSAKPSDRIGDLLGGSISGTDSVFEGDVRFGVDSQFNAVYVVDATTADLDVINELVELLDRKNPSIDEYEGNAGGKDAEVNLEVFLIRVPRNASPEIVSNAAKNIEFSKSDELATRVASVASSLGTKEYDRLSFTTTMGSKTTTKSVSSVPKVQKQNVDPRARQSSSRTEYETYGLNAEITPEIGENCVKVAIKLEKNDAVEGSDDATHPTVLNWTYQSVVRVEPGKPTVIASTSAQQNWILVVNIK